VEEEEGRGEERRGKGIEVRRYIRRYIRR